MKEGMSLEPAATSYPVPASLFLRGHGLCTVHVGGVCVFLLTPKK